MINRGIIVKILVVFLCLISGIAFAYLWQPNSKSMDIYKTALEDFANKDYQNSYYLFSRISFLSDLKPFAIYHQSQCAKELGDKKSEMKQYQLLFNNYRKNKLSVRSRYLAAQMLVDENPSLATNYFQYILEKYPHTDYAIASEYYIGQINLQKYKTQKIFPNSEKNNIENCFRHYLKKAPQGRLALNAANNWLTLDKEISPDDYLLIAQTYFLFEDYQKVKALLTKIELKYGWALDIKNSYALKNYARVKSLAVYGLKNYTSFVDEQDIHEVVDIYLKTADSKKDAIDFLYNVSAANGKDYVWNLKCGSTQSQYQSSCYKQLYINYPNSIFGADALSNIFFDMIKSKDYKNAEKVGKDYLNKFAEGKAAPMVLFWLGKISQHNGKYEESTSLYKSVISKYPDTYYAYRAYIAARHLKTSLFAIDIKPLPVVYPYKGISKNDVILKLAGNANVKKTISNSDTLALILNSNTWLSAKIPVEHLSLTLTPLSFTYFAFNVVPNDAKPVYSSTSLYENEMLNVQVAILYIAKT